MTESTENKIAQDADCEFRHEDQTNVILSSVGRRSYLVHYFRQALAGKGLVIGTNSTIDSPAMLFTDVSYVIPEALDDRYLDELLGICVKHRARLLISLHDWELPFMAAHLEKFKAVGTIPVVSNAKVISLCLDKLQTQEFARLHGIAHPFTVTSPEEASQGLQSGCLKVPMIVKPRFGQGSIGIETVWEASDLPIIHSMIIRRLKHISSNNLLVSAGSESLLFQEKIEGEEFGLDVINDLDGQFVACFVKRKYSMRNGETEVAETVHDQALEELGRRIGTALGHVGPLDVDLIVRSGIPYLLEMSPRFGGHYPFSHMAGANIPAALVAWSRGMQPDPSWLRVRAGVKCFKDISIVEGCFLGTGGKVIDRKKNRGVADRWGGGGVVINNVPPLSIAVGLPAKVIKAKDIKASNNSDAQRENLNLVQNMGKKKVLVFPCGSEIGLEIHRSLKYSMHIDLIGGSSIDDHGRFVYEKYIDTIPFNDEESFIPFIKQVVEEHNIDAIYPTMDSVIAKMAGNESLLGCKIISPSSDVANICLSKSKTYHHLENIVAIPKVYERPEHIEQYPVFIKPDIGYGTRGAKKIHSSEQLVQHLREYPNGIILEYLPGKEYTVDCFTDKKRNLLFVGPRPRRRIMNGISVNTISLVPDKRPFEIVANKINQSLNLRGAWFFQVKERGDGGLVLLEVAPRLGGSSALYRSLGVNFALLSVFDAFDEDVEILYNDNVTIELDRALDNRYKTDFVYEEVYVDFDDCLVKDGLAQTDLVGFIYKCINHGIKVILLTRHERELGVALEKFRLQHVFDSIIHIKDGLPKSHFIKNKKAIFIDDSFAERKEVKDVLGIPVFAPDAVECLL